MLESIKERIQLEKTNSFFKKIWKFVRKEYTKIIILLVVVLFVAFSIYSYNKKQLALYNKYIDEAMQSVSEENIAGGMLSFDEAIKIFPNKPRAYSGRAYAYFVNSQDDESLKDLDKAISLTKEDNPAFMYKLKGDIYKEQNQLEPALEAYAIAYSLLPSDRDYVHDYVSVLVANNQSDKAYPIIKKYFDETPKDDYWNDVDVWVDMSITSYQTQRCLEAGATAWHIMMRSKDGDDTYKIGEAIMSGALNAKDCIDTGEKKEVDTQSMKDAVAGTEAQNMK